MEKTKILFICLGNICRSPSAEAVMKHLVDKKGLNDFFEIDSAGLESYHEGEKADVRMRSHASQRGYNLTSISRPIYPERDFDYFDMIIGMDDQNIRQLKRLVSDEKHLKKIFKMTDFVKNQNISSVPDPYYGGDKGFELVLDLLEKTCEGLLNEIIKQKNYEISSS